ncbi:MAG TPA: gliding motility-associated C-terminal domain-containing protein [Bacteroidetes bacterium]|nr:gliding motility-associated C-terminal domain-containing protein [Bacteroidota bacterium]
MLNIKNHISASLLLIFIICLNTLMNAQLPEFKTLDLGGNETGLVYSLSNGGYAVVGKTDQSGNDDLVLTRLDANLNIISVIEFGDATSEEAMSLVELNNDTLLVSGKRSGGNKPILAKVALSGNIESYNFSGLSNAGQDRMHFLYKSSNTGQIYNYGMLEDHLPGGQWNKISVIQYDKNLNSGWNLYYDNKSSVDDWGEMYAREIVENADTTYSILAVISYGGGPFLEQEGRILTIDSNGNILHITGLDSIFIRTDVRSFCKTQNDGFMIVGFVESLIQDKDFIIYRLDSAFNVLWTKTIGGPGNDEALSIVHLGNDEYVIGGYVTDIGLGGKDACMLKINGNGDIIWAKAYGKAGEDVGKKVINDNGGLLLSGISNSYNTDDDVFIVRTDTSGNIQADCIMDIKPALAIQSYVVATTTYNYSNGTFDLPIASTETSIQISGLIEEQCIICSQTNALSSNDTCLNDSVHFSINNNWADSLYWDFGDGNFDINNNPQGHLYQISGTYTTTLIALNDSLGCNDTSYFSVDIFGLPVADAGPDTLICPGESIQIGEVPDSGSVYSWQSTNNLSAINISNPLAFPLADESFIVTETDSNGCTDIDTIAFVVHPLPDLSLDDTILICNGDTVQLSTLGGSNYSWSPVNVLNNTNISSPLVFPDSTILVYVSFQDSINGCPGNDSVYFNVNYFDSISVSGTDTICLGDTAYLFATGSDSCWWNSGIISNAIQSTPLTTSEYLVWSNNMCGSDTDTFVVTVIIPPVADAGADQVINYGESGSLQGQGGISYMWSPSGSLDCPDCQNATASPSQTTIYTLMVTDSFGCVGIDSVLLELKYMDTLFVPNLFSPNGDGHNDILYVRTFGVFENIHFSLYDRWGKLVFETFDENIGWDGYYNGVQQPLEVYVYYLIANTLDGKTIQQKGDITLMR